MNDYSYINNRSNSFFLIKNMLDFSFGLITKEFRHIDIVKLKLAIIGLILGGILLAFKNKMIDISNSINNISIDYVGISFTSVVIMFFLFAILVGIFRTIKN